MKPREATSRYWPKILALLACSVVTATNSHAQSVSDKETVLKYDLFQVRQAIDKYHSEKKRCPKKLGSLVSEGYMSQIPADPFTNRADWKAINKPSEGPGVFDVRSSSNATAADGTPYSRW
jgi:general secretion pathway protein G